MFKIKIEKQFNPDSKYIDMWFVGYDHKLGPIFTCNESEAGIFISNFTGSSAIYSNLTELYDRYGIKGTPIPDGKVIESVTVDKTTINILIYMSIVAVLAFSSIFVWVASCYFK